MQGLAQMSGVDQNGRPWVSEPSWATQPVYKSGTASMPVTQPDYLPRQQGKTAFNDLLMKKTQEAKDELQRDLESQLLYGKGRYVRNEELRRCIGDAYDKHVNEDTPKEAEVNTAVEKVMAERQEERARKVLEIIDEWLEEYEVASVRSWTVEFTVGAKVYNYAAVYAKDGLWYITNRVGGMKTEVLKGLLAEQAVEANEVVLDNGTVL